MFWFFLAVLLITRSEIGRAIAARIAERPGLGAPTGAELEAVEHRVEERIMELEDRLDFVERLLQQQRARDGLPPIS